MDLADQNAATLGFIPEEALRRGAERGRIIAATSSNGDVFGYFWYSVTQKTEEARLHHLCVGEKSRRSGIGRILTDELKKRTRHLRSITLRCRRDNPACEFYASVGFIPLHERPGRGKDAQILTCFWFNHGHADLETEYGARLAETKAVVVIDANVFIDLQDKDSSTHRESWSLRADWVGEYAKLWITDELYNEINRNEDVNTRRDHRNAAECFPKVRAEEHLFQQALQTINDFLPASYRRSDESDRRHLAWAVASKAEFFVTRDGRLLNHAPQIAESCSLEVCSPLECILGLDEMQRKAEYQPARLAGSGIDIKRISAQDLSGLQKNFLNHGAGETKVAFESLLQKVLGDRDQSCGYVVRDDGNDVALLVTLQANGAAMEIPLFRVIAGGLSPTLARHLLAWVMARIPGEGRSLVLLTDRHCPGVVAQCVDELGFLGTQQERAKICIPGLRSIESTANELTALRKRFPNLDSAFDAASRALDAIRDTECPAEAIHRVERVLWPLKIDDRRLRSFMVPIQAKWAQHLFDVQLAAQSLFPVDTFLALQCENVYYRAARPRIVTAPGRVLWYVSEDRDFVDGTARIKACSHIDEVVVGPANALFKRHSRLGVYRWEDVLALAKNDPEGEIMAFRFSGTELMRSPIRMNEIRAILRGERDATPQFTTVLALKPPEFARLYRKGRSTQ